MPLKKDALRRGLKQDGEGRPWGRRTLNISRVSSEVFHHCSLIRQCSECLVWGSCLTSEVTLGPGQFSRYHEESEWARDIAGHIGGGCAAVHMELEGIRPGGLLSETRV